MQSSDKAATKPHRGRNAFRASRLYPLRAGPWPREQCEECRMMRYGRVAAVAFLTAGAVAALPMSEASARCWSNGWGWHCGPGLLALPFIAAGAAVAVATAPVRAVVGGPYYPYYYGPPGYYGPPPSYYAPPGYYYGPPAPPAVNN